MALLLAAAVSIVLATLVSRLCLSGLIRAMQEGEDRVLPHGRKRGA